MQPHKVRRNGPERKDPAGNWYPPDGAFPGPRGLCPLSHALCSGLGGVSPPAPPSRRRGPACLPPPPLCPQAPSLTRAPQAGSLAAPSPPQRVSMFPKWLETRGNFTLSRGHIMGPSVPSVLSALTHTWFKPQSLITCWDSFRSD